MRRLLWREQFQLEQAEIEGFEPVSFTFQPQNPTPSPCGLLQTEAERGRMVKEWDFEAGKKFKRSKKIQNPTLFYVLWPLLAFFSVIHGVSLLKTG